jgi:hypothetical protein
MISTYNFLSVPTVTARDGDSDAAFPLHGAQILIYNWSLTLNEKAVIMRTTTTVVPATNLTSRLPLICLLNTSSLSIFACINVVPNTYSVRLGHSTLAQSQPGSFEDFVWILVYARPLSASPSTLAQLSLQTHSIGRKCTSQRRKVLRRGGRRAMISVCVIPMPEFEKMRERMSVRLSEY